MGMTTIYTVLFIAIVSYVLGAISFAWLISRIRGVDILKVGSCNPGFTNVWRTQGMKVAIFVLIGDMLKGTSAAYIGAALLGDMGMLLAAIMVLLGHTFSFMIHFKGGKGIATGAGILLYISPIAFLLCFLTLSSLAYLTKYMSVGSIAAAILCPVYLYLTHQSSFVIAVFIACGLFVIWMHRTNIVRLMNGTENKIGYKEK